MHLRAGDHLNESLCVWQFADHYCWVEWIGHRHARDHGCPETSFDEREQGGNLVAADVVVDRLVAHSNGLVAQTMTIFEADHWEVLIGAMGVERSGEIEFFAE